MLSTVLKFQSITISMRGNLMNDVIAEVWFFRLKIFGWGHDNSDAAGCFGESEFETPKKSLIMIILAFSAIQDSHLLNKIVFIVEYFTTCKSLSIETMMKNMQLVVLAKKLFWITWKYFTSFARWHFRYTRFWCK